MKEIEVEEETPPPPPVDNSDKEIGVNDAGELEEEDMPPPPPADSSNDAQSDENGAGGGEETSPPADKGDEVQPSDNSVEEEAEEETSPPPADSSNDAQSDDNSLESEEKREEETPPPADNGDDTQPDDNGVEDAEETDEDTTPLKDDDVGLAEVFPDTIIAGYTMSNAVYTGTYTSNYYFGIKDATFSGYAELHVDFGNESVDLSFDHGEWVFNQNTEFSGDSFRVEGVNDDYGTSVAHGTFQEPTGNVVKGDFRIPISEGRYREGTYEVESSQELH